MTLPTWISVGTVSAGSSTTNPGLPAGWQENDIFVLTVESRNGAAGAPSGYTEISSSPQFNNASLTTDDTALNIYWKRATASESGPSMGDSGNHTISRIHAIRDCIDTGDPINVTDGATEDVTDTTFTLPSVTTTEEDCLILGAVTNNLNTSFSSWVNANLDSLTERADDGTTAGDDGSLGVATGGKTAAGSTGTTTVTTAASVRNAGIILALTPVPQPIDYVLTPSDTLELIGSTALVENTVVPSVVKHLFVEIS